MANSPNASMTKQVLDAVVRDLREIPERLDGDDSPLADSWEDIKEQIQTELSPFWSAYLDIIRGNIGSRAGALPPDDRARLAEELGVSIENADGMERALMKRLAARAKREKIRYRPFSFTHFQYRIGGMPVYALVLERTGRSLCRIIAYSQAAPSGENGEIDPDVMDDTMTAAEFGQARAQGWQDR